MIQRAQVRPPPTPIPLQVKARPVDNGPIPQAPEWQPSETLIAYSKHSAILAEFLGNRQQEAAERAVKAGEAVAPGDDPARLAKAGEEWVQNGGDRSLLPHFREGLIRVDARRAAHDRFLLAQDPKFWEPLTAVQDATGLAGGVPQDQIEAKVDELFGRELPMSVQNEFGNREYREAVTRYRQNILENIQSKRSAALVEMHRRDLAEELMHTMDALDDGPGPVGANALSDWADTAVFQAGVENPTEFVRETVKDWVNNHGVKGAAEGERAIRIASNQVFGGRRLGDDAKFADWAKSRSAQFAERSIEEDSRTARAYDARRASVSDGTYVDVIKRLDVTKKAGGDVAGAADILLAEIDRQEEDGFNPVRKEAIQKALNDLTTPATDDESTINMRVGEAMTSGKSKDFVKAIITNSRTGWDFKSKMLGSLDSHFEKALESSTTSKALTSVAAMAAVSSADMSQAGKIRVNALSEQGQAAVRAAVLYAAESGADDATIRAAAQEAAKTWSDRISNESASEHDFRANFISAQMEANDRGIDYSTRIEQNRSLLTEAEYIDALERNTRATTNTYFANNPDLESAIRELNAAQGAKADAQSLLANAKRFRADLAAWVAANRPGMNPSEFSKAYLNQLGVIASEIIGGPKTAEGGGPSAATRVEQGESITEAAEQVDYRSKAVLVHAGVRNFASVAASEYTKLASPEGSAIVTEAVGKMLDRMKDGESQARIRRPARMALLALAESAEGKDPDKIDPKDINALVQAGAITIDDLRDGTVTIVPHKVTYTTPGVGDRDIRHEYQPAPVKFFIQNAEFNPYLTPLFKSEAQLYDWFNNRAPELQFILSSRGITPGDMDALRLAQLELLGFSRPDTFK